MAKGEAIALRVRYYNVLRHRTGVEQETIVLPAGAELHSALAHLAERHGPQLRTMLFGLKSAIQEQHLRVAPPSRPWI